MSTTEGGEHPHGRAAMERLQKAIRESGGSSEYAQEKAREAARREDLRRQAGR